MVPAALPLEKRNKRENTIILCVHKHLSSTDMLTDIIEDFRKLEDGIMMYDTSCNEEVLVIAPLNFIIADNAWHSELACHKGARANFPCRKCFYCVRSEDEDIIIDNYDSAISQSLDEITALNTNGVCRHNLLLPNGQTRNVLDKLGYKRTGGEVLLPHLRAFDQMKNLPIELLHCLLMLGVTKYIMYFLVKYLNTCKTADLQAKLRSYSSKTFGWTMGNCLRLSSTSFVRRDFKVMSQLLPVILNDLLHIWMDRNCCRQKIYHRGLV